MRQLKYDIRDIGDEGVVVAGELPSAQVQDILSQAGVKSAGVSRARLDLLLTLAEDTVLVEGGIHGAYHVDCARCLEPAEIVVEDTELRLTFLAPSKRAEQRQEEELALEDLDTYTHDGRQVDLEPLVREQLLLALPMTPLCRPDCRGFCTGCGTNLNHERCRCAHREAPDAEATPWREAIGKLKKDAGRG